MMHGENGFIGVKMHSDTNQRHMEDWLEDRRIPFSQWFKDRLVLVISNDYGTTELDQEVQNLGGHFVNLLAQGGGNATFA